MIERRNGITAACDRNQRAIKRQCRRHFGECDGCSVKWWRFKRAHRAIPHERPAIFEDIAKRLNRRRANIKDHFIGCNFMNVDSARRRVAAKFLRYYNIIR